MEKVIRMVVRCTMFLLPLLWAYAAVSKLSDYGQFKQEMHEQLLYPFLQELLIYALPLVELGVSVLFIVPNLKELALQLSLLLLSVFSAYIGLALLKPLKNRPCSCGGILEGMGWTTHFLFNIFFLLLTAATLYIIKRKETWR